MARARLWALGLCGSVSLLGCQIDARKYLDSDASDTDASKPVTSSTPSASASTTNTEPGPDDAGSQPSEDASVADSSADSGAASCSKAADCDDGNPCNGDEECRGGACFAGETAADGIECGGDAVQDGGLRICVLGSCIQSRCGDQITASDEECDDGNSEPQDGCEADCKFTCSKDADCPELPICEGTSTCDTDKHVCLVGKGADDLTPCADGMVCSHKVCVAEGCGNGTQETGEECDDGNAVLNDGCEANCTYSCNSDKDCDNQDVCDGSEVCDLDAHVCVAGETLDCADNDDCTVDTCDPTLGCVWPAVDGDGDGHSPKGCKGGDDCDDDNANVYTGAPELCDDLDNNCDEQADETELNWYKDCDGDGYAVMDALPRVGCQMPPAPTDCDSGLAATWTTRVPSSEGESDCWDKDPTVHPRTSDSENNLAWSSTAIGGRSVSENYDYNCFSGNEPRYTTTSVSTSASCSELILIPLKPAVSPISADPLAINWFDGPALNASQIIDPGVIIIQPALCVGTDGWTGSSAPACGQPANYSDCSGATGSCKRSTISMTQQCR